MIGYNIDKEGYIVEIGLKEYSDFENDLTNEPFNMDNCHLYKKDMSTGEWIYLPDITPVNKEIIDVKYDWQQMKAYITIADQFRPGPYEFDCVGTWTEQDCINAINSKFT